MLEQTFKLNNTTNALIPSKTLDLMLLNKGKYFASVVLERTFSAAEIGTDPGKTKDNANGAYGFLFCQFEGADIEIVEDIVLWKDITYNTTAIGRTKVVPALNYKIVKSSAAPDAQGYERGLCSLYIFDAGVAGPPNTTIQAGSSVTMRLQVGNTP